MNGARCGALVLLASLAACDRRVTLHDFSPDGENGLPSTGASSHAGLTIGLAGSAARLYAVSLNAGVWRSTSSDLGDPGPWTQLQRSPPGSYSVAVDPTSAGSRLAVGQRQGEERDPATSRSGVWESSDGGEAWALVFDPREANPRCPSRAIPSLVYTGTGALVVATSCGIAVRSTGGRSFAFPASAAALWGDRPVSAVAASPTRVWARDAAYNLLVSRDDGQSWSAVPPPPRGTRAAGTGDGRSLAAFGAVAVMVCLGGDTEAGNNYTKLVLFDDERNAWIEQERVADAVNGTGAGGRRFVRAYSGPRGRIGEDAEVFVSSAQEVHRATARNADGTLAFALAGGSGASGAAPPTDPDFGNVFHADIWELHWDRAARRAWVGTDGGVSEARMDGRGWRTRSRGLHTHHAHTLVAPDAEHVVYSTQDNDAWMHVGKGAEWRSVGDLGDVNFTAADAGLPGMALVARRFGTGCPGGGCALLLGLGESLPTSRRDAVRVTLAHDTTFFQNPLAFQLLQTRKGEAHRALDAVMLTRLPLVARRPGGATETLVAGTGFALVRNREYEKSPDVDAAGAGAWQLAADRLPEGVLGFWASAKKGHSAHESPRFFVYSSANGAPSEVWEGDGRLPTTWTRIDPFGGGGGALVGGGGRFGPVFVNPYDADEMYVLAQDHVRVGRRTDGVWTFSAERALSDLVSGSGRYPFVAAFSGGNAVDVDRGNQNGGTGLGTLEAMAWDRDDPSHVAAVSPFTGAFVNLGDGRWRDLSGYLPKPLAPPSAVALTGSRLYVLTEGRGLVYLDEIDAAP